MRNGVKHTKATRVPGAQFGGVLLKFSLVCAAFLAYKFRSSPLTLTSCLCSVFSMHLTIARATIADYIS
jgi:hypothetical protein